MSAQDQRGESSPESVGLARFTMIGPGAPGDPISVHFNPESLEYTVTNNIKEQGSSSESKQQVSKSSGKLSMELVFDTTLNGTDVREETEKLQALMKPAEDGDEKIAPVVEFAWGVYRFRGIFSSYKETLDYFSSTGVPLRASISLSMTQQDGLFSPTARGEAEIDDDEVFSPAGDAAEDPANRGPATGDPEVDRALAEDNGEENPRFFSGDELSLPGGPDLLPAIAFASGGLSVGGGFGLDVGIEAGFSVGVSAGIGIGLGIEAGIDVGLSAGFDVDIGIDIGFEASIDIGVSASLDVGLGIDVDVDVGVGGGASGGGGASVGGSTGGGASGGGATRGGSSGAGSAGGGVGGDAIAGGGADPSFSGAFGGGEYRRSGPAAAVRTRARGPGATIPGDDSFDALPAGPRFGGKASAGVPAAFNAFAGLHPVPPRRRRPVSLSRLRPRRPERDLRTDTGASFEIGGQALDRTPGGLGADVGARATLAGRIAFDDTAEGR